MRDRPKHPSAIGVRVHLLRTKGDISARELDRLAGITTGHTSLVETAIGDGVSGKTLAGMARALGTTIDWLVTGVGREPGAETVKQAIEAARRRSAA